MKNFNNNFDIKNVQPVDLKLLNGQVDLILRALELYSYNMEYMLNSSDVTNDERQEKIAKLKYTYEQILSSQAEQVNGKDYSIDELSNYEKKMINDNNIINIIPKDKKINIR